MPRVHVITHAVVETTCPIEIYSMVAEHLDRTREYATIEAMTIQHGDYETEGHEPHFSIEPDEPGVAFIGVGDQGLSVPELQRLAMNTLVAIKKAGG